jgi:hypothetical protein
MISSICFNVSSMPFPATDKKNADRCSYRSCCTEQLSKRKRDLMFTRRTGGGATRKCNYH